MADDPVVNEGGVPSGSDPNEMGGDPLAPGGGNGTVPQPNWREFVDGLDRLNTELGSKLTSVDNRLAEATRPPPAEPPKFDEMSNAELVAHMTGSIGDMIQRAIGQALDPITKQLNTVQTDVVTTRSTLELRRMQAEHKDFVDWKDEMIGLAKQHPTLGFEDAYRLARASNPAKAGTLDNRYNPPPPKPRPFGGLIPSGNGRAATPPLTGEEAGKAAYQEVAARHPGILPALQEL